MYITFHLHRFVKFTYTEVDNALKELDDGVFFVREMKESEEMEYEICIRYYAYKWWKIIISNIFWTRWKDDIHRIKISGRQVLKPFSITDDKSFNTLPVSAFFR